MSVFRRFQLFLAVFFAVLMAYPLVLRFLPYCHLVRVVGLCGHLCAGLLILVLSAALVAVITCAAVHLLYTILCDNKPRWPKAGRVLVCEGCLTEEELEEALAQRRARLDEILLKTGSITEQGLSKALDRQSADGGKLDQILREAGYVTQEQILEAVGRADREFEEVLRQKSSLTGYEMWALPLVRCGPKRT